MLHNIEPEYRAATIRAMEAELDASGAEDQDALQARRDQLLEAMTNEDLEAMAVARQREEELEGMDADVRGAALEAMPLPQRMAVLENMPVEYKAPAIAAMDQQAEEETLREMRPEACVLVFHALPTEQSQAALELMPESLQQEIRAEEEREQTLAEMRVDELKAAIAAMSPAERSLHHRHILKNREKAFAKFKTLDPDGRGYLESAQVLELAGWVWKSFRPGQGASPNPNPDPDPDPNPNPNLDSDPNPIPNLDSKPKPDPNPNLSIQAKGNPPQPRRCKRRRR